MEAASLSLLIRRLLMKLFNKVAPSSPVGGGPPFCVIRPCFMPSEKAPTMLPGPRGLLLSSSATSLEEAVLTKLLEGGRLLSAGGSAGVFRVAHLGNARARRSSQAWGELVPRCAKSSRAPLQKTSLRCATNGSSTLAYHSP